jgi:pyrimidine operon attenuation protein/uracil phosphoribosyltransferase
MQAIDTAEVEAWLDRIAGEMQGQCSREECRALQIVGIHTGGVRVAEALHQRIAPDNPLATLDVAFYRDDFTRSGLQPRVRPSRLPLSIDDGTVLLVDDVLYSGRTVRAALNELFDYGRPARVMLAVLIERTGRALPICADFVGQRLDLTANQRVRLNTEDLGLVVYDVSDRTSSHGE